MNRDRNPWAINTEILSDREIKEFFVNEEKYLLEMQDNESYLLEGCRGVGKTMLMKYSQIILLEEFEEKNVLPVYVSFAESLKLDRLKTNNEILKKDIFIRWTISKILNELIKTYTHELEQELNLKTDFQRFFKINTYEKIIEDLPKFINDLEIISYEENLGEIENNYKELWVKTIDITYFKQFIEEFINKHSLKRIVFYFDEAAHTLFPYQQALFFTIFKKLKSQNIACKASVYPLITNYGNDFQPTQDAKKIIIDKDDESESLLAFFKEFYEKRIKLDPKREILENNLKKVDNTFNTIVYASSGNPRRFLNLIEKIRQQDHFNRTKLTHIIREHAHNELWEYHDKLVQGNIELRAYAEIGKEFINEHIISTLQEANKKREKKFRTFSIDSDINHDFLKMLKTLEYSGIIDFKKQLKLREGTLGNYYNLNLALCFSENIIKIDEINNLEFRRCPSLTKNSPVIQQYTKKIVDLLSSNCPQCKSKIYHNMKFCPQCGYDLRNIESVFERMVKQPIDLLKIELIGDKIMKKLKEKFETIKDLMDAEDSEILKIYLIGPKRLKNVRIAINDYISG